MEKIYNINFEKERLESMQKNKLNNVIVLKEISSNIVEEAIVVLKPHVNLKQEEKQILALSKQKIPEKNKSILKEAEYVIQNCIEQMEYKNKQIASERLKNRYKFLKKIIMFSIIVNILLLLKIF